MMIAAMSLATTLLSQPPLSNLDGLEFQLLDTGAVQIKVTDAPPLSLGLVLWHGEWRYVNQSQMKEASVTRTENGAVVEGDMKDAQGVTALHVRSTVTRGANELSLRYVLSKPAEISLRRGVLLELRVPRPDYDHRRQFVPPATTLRIPARASSGSDEYWLEVTRGKALVMRLSQPVGFQLAPEGGSYLVRAGIAPDEFQERSVEVTLSVASMPDRLPGEVVGDNRALAVADVNPRKATVLRHALYEARIELAGTYQNPFDPDQIAVDAHFTSPSGRELVVPCFYRIDFARKVVDNVEKLDVTDAGSWWLRFTPEEVGRYTFYITARDASGQVNWRGGELDVKPSELPGFVRVAPQNPRYLELSTGQSLFPIGHNLPTYYVSRFLPDTELSKMRAGGENYNRWWMYSAELGLEFEHALGWYRQTSAWRMDFLLRLAEELGFWYMLCLDTHQDFRGQQGWEGWPNNPYNAVLGGPCQNPADFFTNPTAKQYYKKRLRYLVARYGWSTRVLCWEFGNEFEGWPETPPEDLLAWHREMSDYLRSIDPYRHLITTSFWTPAGRREVWELPNIDIVQTHHYANTPRDMARMVAADCNEKYSSYRKPHIYGEVGLDSRLRLEPRDSQGYYLHNCIWAALMSGAASTAMSWWHESYIDKYNLYGVYRGLAEFVRDVPLSKYEWRPVKLSGGEWIEKPQIPLGDLIVSPSFGWGKPAVTRFEVSRLGEVNNPDQVPSLLQGRGHQDIRTPVTFVVAYPAAGKFVVHVDRVSRSGLLKVFVDDKQVAEFELPCAEGLGKQSVWREEWQLWETVYDEDYSVDVPAGRHEIRLENDGGDWIRVANYRFIGARSFDVPDHLVLGIASPEMILLWVRNDDFTWFNAVDGKVRPRPPCRLVFSGVSPGEYSVEAWDTWQGQITGQSRIVADGETLTVDIPALERDVALKLKRQEANR